MLHYCQETPKTAFLTMSETTLQHLDPQSPQFRIQISPKLPYLFDANFGELYSQRIAQSSCFNSEGSSQINLEFSKARPPAIQCLGLMGWQPRKHQSQQRKELAGWGFKSRKLEEIMTRYSSYTTCKQFLLQSCTITLHMQLYGMHKSVHCDFWWRVTFDDL